MYSASYVCTTSKMLVLRICNFGSESGQLCAIKEVRAVCDDQTSKECLKQLNQVIMSFFLRDMLDGLSFTTHRHYNTFAVLLFTVATDLGLINLIII